MQCRFNAEKKHEITTRIIGAYLAWTNECTKVDVRVLWRSKVHQLAGGFEQVGWVHEVALALALACACEHRMTQQESEGLNHGFEFAVPAGLLACIPKCKDRERLHTVPT
jgi:hypothetical protein